MDDRYFRLAADLHKGSGRERRLYLESHGVTLNDRVESKLSDSVFVYALLYALIGEIPDPCHARIVFNYGIESKSFKNGLQRARRALVEYDIACLKKDRLAAEEQRDKLDLRIERIDNEILKLEESLQQEVSNEGSEYDG